MNIGLLGGAGDHLGGLLCCVYGKSVENRCPWVGRRDSEVTGQLQEKGTSNMGEECGEWLEDGETVTYDPCPPRPRRRQL